MDIDKTKYTQENFDNIFKEHHGMVKRFLSSRMQKCPMDIDDVVQKTFISCYKNISSYRGEGKFSTWLLQIAKNRCYDYWKSYQVNQKYIPTVPTEKVASLIEQKPIDAQEIKDNQLEDEKINRVLKIINKLHPLDKDIITSQFLKGIKTDDIAKRLNLSGQAVRIRSFRIRKEILRRYNGQGKKRTNKNTSKITVLSSNG